MDEALLALVAADPGVSAAKACKRLGVSRSELQRWLTFDAGQRVRVQEEDTRQTLWPAS